MTQVDEACRNFAQSESYLRAIAEITHALSQGIRRGLTLKEFAQEFVDTFCQSTIQTTQDSLTDSFTQLAERTNDTSH